MSRIETKLYKHDQVCVLRALCKISSALINFDNANDDNYFTEEFKSELQKFETYFKNGTDYTLSILVKENDNMLVSILNEFNKSDNLINIPESTEKQVGIAIAKIKSAFIHDIYDLKNKDLMNMYRKQFLIFGMKLLGHNELKGFQGIVLDKMVEGFKDIGLQIISNPQNQNDK
jgi:hypothetical protein